MSKSDEVRLDVDKLIYELIKFSCQTKRRYIDFDIKLISTLIRRVRELFLSQPMLLNLSSPITVCGDLHGQFTDLIRVFEKIGYPSDLSFLFLGDYVDRGKQSLETILLLFAYKLKYADSFFLLRGNHESENVNSKYGFLDICKRNYNTKLFKEFNDCFNCMPIAAVISERVFCCHGGISPDLMVTDILDIERPLLIPDQGLVCDLLWSDPDPDILDYGENNRQVSCTFGSRAVDEFLDRNDLELICRAHQVVEDGYQFFFKRKVVSLFTAPNYCGEYDNAGAVLNIDAELRCHFKILKPSLMLTSKDVKHKKNRAKSRDKNYE